MNAQQWVAAQGHVDGVDQAAMAAERKWGVGRLRLLVGAELRARFDRQRVRLNDAIAAGSADALAVECRRMCSAYVALDAAAEAAGAQARPDAWEVVVDDDVILTFVRSDADAARFPLDGFKREVWGLDEVAKLIAEYPVIRAAKRRFGAHVEAIRRAVEDPVPAASTADFPRVDLDDINWSGLPRDADGKPVAGAAVARGAAPAVAAASDDPTQGFD